MTGIVRTGVGVQVGTSVTATNNFSIYQPASPDGTVRIANGSPETPTDVAQFDSAGNFKFNSGYGSVATAYACRAWCNFNGTGAVAIRASGNVTGITDNGTGDYTVNFTTAMPDANYCASVDSDSQQEEGWTVSSSSIRFLITNSSGALKDTSIISVAIFR